MNPADRYLNDVFAGLSVLIAFELLLAIAAFSLWIVALVHCLKNKHDSDRLTWVLVVMFLGPLGALLYLTIVRTKQMSVPTLLPPVLGATTAQIAKHGEPPLFDHLAMADEKKRAEAMADALWKEAAARRRKT